jgi:site-specific recombinase XerC
VVSSEKGRKSGGYLELRLNSGTLLAIKDYQKATENGTDPSDSLFQTLGKHGPYEERGLTAKAIDCLVRSVVKKALIQKRVHPHVMRHTFATTLLDNGNDLKIVLLHRDLSRGGIEKGGRPIPVPGIWRKGLLSHAL